MSCGSSGVEDQGGETEVIGHQRLENCGLLSVNQVKGKDDFIPTQGASPPLQLISDRLVCPGKVFIDYGSRCLASQVTLKKKMRLNCTPVFSL